ncbi:hypothetical protein A3F06_02300 [candidate division TM6 bacterium RIFCSPHIGHO2_12_FULL_36_22]|nr:MAG: hypothetical protein A3F06_02300 [candidate division TM6 bacterium RIFCSPHIGHO2_12_FULL_36_22]
MSKTQLQIFFGDKTTAIDPSDIRHKTFQFKNQPTILQHQIHSAQGQQILSNNKAQPCLSIDGDYLITQEKLLNIAVLTADCLPIIFYDNKSDACGIAHAGWRGTTQEIVLKTICHMQQAFDTKINNLSIWFGPAAQICCYEVQENFIQNLPHPTITSQVLRKEKLQYYFDVSLYNIALLQSIGIPKEHINLSHNLCTICNLKFCSYRRDKGSPIRQISLIGLY